MSEPLPPHLTELLRNQQMDEACRLILRTNGPEIRGYLRGMMGNVQDGDDVYQDLSVALWQHLGSFQQRCSVRTWLYVIAHNLASKRLQRASHRGYVRLDSETAARLVARSTRSTRERLAREEAFAALQEQLTPEDCELIILRGERGFSYKRIATILNLSEDVAKQRYHRVKERLKALASQIETEA